MKKIIVKALMIAGVVAGSFGSMSAMALDPQVQSACTNAFEGKCLHGGVVDLSQFNNEDYVTSYCQPGATFCSDVECRERLNIILGNIIGPEKGNPCIQ